MYTVHQTKTNLSKLLKEVEAGNEIIIARGDVPVAKIVPIKKPLNRKPGRLKGAFELDPNFFDPLTEEELKDWGIE
jgi:prevent-host-death family protein